MTKLRSGTTAVSMMKAGINMLHQHYLLKAVYFPVHHQPRRLPLVEHLQVVQTGERKK
jgi:hypothetical protein